MHAYHSFIYSMHFPELTLSVALVHAVYTEYGRYLHGLGLEKAAYFFANKAGPKAKQLLDGL